MKKAGHQLPVDLRYPQGQDRGVRPRTDNIRWLWHRPGHLGQAGDHNRDNNDAKSFGVRVSGVLSDRFEAGASYYHGAWDNDGEYNLDMFGFHFLGKIGDLDLYAEYSDAKSENPNQHSRAGAHTPPVNALVHKVCHKIGLFRQCVGSNSAPI